MTLQRHFKWNDGVGRLSLSLVLALFVVCPQARTEVIDTVLTFPPNVSASWSPVDFDGDGVNDVSFSFYGIGTESSTSFVLEFAGNGKTQAVGQNGSVLPLNAGDTFSLTPAFGLWMDPGLERYVWIQLFNGQLQGVGAPGTGDFMGVRFQTGSDWHFGWIRFGMYTPPTPTPALPFSSVLEYAYETLPNTPIVVPEPQVWILAGLGFVIAACRRRS